MILAALPAALVFAALALGATAIVVLHLVRRRRRRVMVPFGMLWQQVLGAERRRLGMSRPRELLSLFLSLLILGAMVLAAGDPRRGRGAGVAARTVVLLVDASASMQALDDKGDRGEPVTRMVRARREARRTIAALGPEDRALVIRLDDAPRAASGFTGDARLLEAQIDAIEAGPGQADLDGGLRLAADLLAGRPGATLVLVGDGAWPPEVLGRVRLGAVPGAQTKDLAAGRAGPPEPADPIALDGVDLRYLAVGSSGANVAITAFAARRVPAHPADYEVLVELRSFRADSTEVELQLFLDGEIVSTRRLSLAPGARVTRIESDLAGSGSRIEARLVVAPVPVPVGTGLGATSPLDVFPLDDRAFARLQPRRMSRVLLVTSGNLYLEGALLLDESLRVERLAPDAFRDGSTAGYDAVLFDGYTPPSPPAIPALYLDPHGTASPFATAGTLHAPPVTRVAHHPLTRYVTFADLNLGEASRFKLAPGDVGLAFSGGDPIYAAREQPVRVAALGFDVRRSDLPLRVAFPVMLMNACDWLTGGATDDSSDAASGATTDVASTGTTTGTTTDDSPDGRQGESIDPAESRIAPAAFLTVDGRRIFSSGGRGGASGGDSRDAAAEPAGGTTWAFAESWHRADPWRVLLWLALALLFVEWWAFHRRVSG